MSASEQPKPASSDPVLDRLVEFIAEKKLQPGDALPSVRTLAQAWGMGRNAVRDGLLRAQTVGLVEVRPRSGVVVREADCASMLDLLSQALAPAIHQRHPALVHLWQARALIESETAANAARRRLPEDLQAMRRYLEEMCRHVDVRERFVHADEQFHLVIARTMGNPVVVVILEALLKLLRTERVKGRPDPQRKFLTDTTHRAVYRAIAAGDPAGAAAAMADHLERRLQFLIDLEEPR